MEAAVGNVDICTQTAAHVRRRLCNSDVFHVITARCFHGDRKKKKKHTVVFIPQKTASSQKADRCATVSWCLACPLPRHPTSCCSVAEIMSVLFFHTMKYRYDDPRNFNNDRFIMSKVTAAEAAVCPTVS